MGRQNYLRKIIYTLNLKKMKENESLRFRKQEILPFMGKDGMRKIKASTVVVIGLGGGGCSASLQLATANVGRLVLCDFDTVGESNLGRQFLHSHSTLGIDKVISAKIALRKINPFIEIETISKPISNQILEDLYSRYKDLSIFVAVDKFEAHYMINNFCINHNIPAVHIAQLGYKGFVYTYIPGISVSTIKNAISVGFDKNVNEGKFDTEEQDLPYFAPIISIVCATAIVELIKVMVGVSNKKTLANTFLIYRAIEHEHIFEKEQVNKPFFEEIKLNH